MPVRFSSTSAESGRYKLNSRSSRRASAQATEISRSASLRSSWWISMVATAPSIVPRQVTIVARARAGRPDGRRARPAAAALMLTKRRREMVRVIVSSSIAWSVPRIAILVGGGALLGAIRRQDVVSRHLVEADDVPSMFADEHLRGRPVGEGDGLIAAHAALELAADHKQCFMHF